MKRYISIIVFVFFGVQTTTYAASPPVVLLPPTVPITDPVLPLNPGIPRAPFGPQGQGMIKNVFKIGSEVSTEVTAEAAELGGVANRWKWLGPVGVAVGIILEGLFKASPAGDPVLDTPPRPKFPPKGFAMSTHEEVSKRRYRTEMGRMEGVMGPCFNSSPSIINGSQGAKNPLYPGPYALLPLKLQRDGIFGRIAVGEIPSLTEITARNLDSFEGPVYTRTENPKSTPVTILHIDEEKGIVTAQLPDILESTQKPFLDMNPIIVIPLQEFKRKPREGEKLTLDLMVSERYFFTVNAPLELPQEESKYVMVESIPFLIESVHPKKNLLIAQCNVDFRRYVSKISTIETLSAQPFQPGDLLYLNEITDVALFHIYDPDKHKYDSKRTNRISPLFQELQYGKPATDLEAYKRSQFLMLRYQAQIMNEILTYLGKSLKLRITGQGKIHTPQGVIDLVRLVEKQVSKFLDQMIVEPHQYQFGNNLTLAQRDFLLQVFSNNAVQDPGFAEVLMKMRLPEFKVFFTYLSTQYPEVFSQNYEPPERSSTTPEIIPFPGGKPKPPNIPSE